jgi:hypothetical protein
VPRLPRILSLKSGRITTIDFDDRIWGELKVWLLKNVFNNKCAYCETPLPRQSGHAEHFRPKGGVKYKTEKKSITAFTKDALENQIEHPGYFWLAYNWKNLLPSCELCNAGGGKKNQFPCKAPHLLILPLTNAELANIKEPPIASGKWPGKYYLKPGDLDEREKTKLLHPYFDDPEKHIIFGYAGIEAPTQNDNGEPSEIGRTSIEVYDLGNENLRRERQRAQIQAVNTFLVTYNAEILRGKKPAVCRKKALNAIKEYKTGIAPYSAAAMDFLRQSLSAMNITID